MTLVLRYPFNNAVTEDVSPNAHQSQAYEGVTLVDDPEMGKVVAFDGARTAYIMGPQLDAVEQGVERTVSYWVYIDEANSYGFTHATGDYPLAWRGYTRGTSAGSMWILGPGFNVPSLALLESETWYHVCETYDGSRVELHVNGQSHGSKLQNFQVESNNIYLGRPSDSNMHANRFIGRMSDFRVYNVALSREEIQNVYSLGANGVPEIPGKLRLNSIGATSLSLGVEGDPNLEYSVVVGNQVVDSVKSGNTVNINHLEPDTTYVCQLFKPSQNLNIF